MAKEVRHMSGKQVVLAKEHAAKIAIRKDFIG